MTLAPHFANFYNLTIVSFILHLLVTSPLKVFEWNIIPPQNNEYKSYFSTDYEFGKSFRYY